VVVRCRPFSEKEKAAGHSCIVQMELDRNVVSINDPEKPTDPSKTFTFDSVFDSNSEQISVYDTTARPIVDSALNGYNGTIFACMELTIIMYFYWITISVQKIILNFPHQFILICFLQMGKRGPGKHSQWKE
jgi:hypothetical protein